MHAARACAAFYGELLDGVVADEPLTDLPGAATGDPHGRPRRARRRLAEQTLAFAGHACASGKHRTTLG